jgi:hypothetical protein
MLLKVELLISMDYSTGCRFPSLITIYGSGPYIIHVPNPNSTTYGNWNVNGLAVIERSDNGLHVILGLGFLTRTMH